MAALLSAISHQTQDLREHIIKLDAEINALDHAEPRDSETALCSIRRSQQDLEDCQQDIDTKDDAISQVIKIYDHGKRKICDVSLSCSYQLEFEQCQSLGTQTAQVKAMLMGALARLREMALRIQLQQSQDSLKSTQGALAKALIASQGGQVHDQTILPRMKRQLEAAWLSSKEHDRRGRIHARTAALLQKKLYAAWSLVRTKDVIIGKLRRELKTAKAAQARID